MKNITIKRNSWHFWVACNLGGRRWSSTNQDFCAYVRRIILGLFLGTFLFSFCLFFVILYFWSGYEWATWVRGILFHGAHSAMPKFAIPFVVVNSVALLIGVILGLSWAVTSLKNYLDDRACERRVKVQQKSIVPKEPSFAQTAYRSVKDKICFKMNIVD